MCLKNKIITLLLLGIVFQTDTFSQNSISFMGDSIDSYITNAMALWEIPGVAVAVVKNDTIVYAKGFGVKAFSSQEKVDANTLFPIWSMGKSFTAFSLALLENKGLLNLDKPVKRYYPTFNMSNELYENEVNSIDLLSHRIGIEMFRGDFLWSETSLSTDDLLRKWALINPEYTFRSTFKYSNYGYLVAGKVIEKVSGNKWQSFIKKEVLVPLKMDNSYLFMDEVNTQNNVSKGHTKVESNLIPTPEGTGQKIEPFGGMYSSVLDMAKWLQLNINKGVMNGERLFEEQIFEKTHKPYNIVGKMFLPNGTNPNVNYGLGWEIRDYHDMEVITHGGAYSGFVSMMGFVPKAKLGFVILTNSDANELGEALKWQIIDAYLEKPYQNYSDAIYQYASDAEERWLKRVEHMKDSILQGLKTTVNLNAFAGVYESELYGKAFIDNNSKKILTLKFEHHPTLEATLSHIGNNRFFCEYSHPMFGKVVLPFIVKNNQVIGFELSVHPFVEFNTYDFRKIN